MREVQRDGSADVSAAPGYLVSEGVVGWFVTRGPAAPQFAISNKLHATREEAEAESWQHYNRAADAALELQVDYIRFVARRMKP